MTHPGSVQQIVLVILGGGGAVAIFTLVKAFLALRESTDTREATGIANLERWRNDAEKRASRFLMELEYERLLTRFWWERSGILEHLARTGGVEIPPCPSVPPPPPELRMMSYETRPPTQDPPPLSPS